MPVQKTLLIIENITKGWLPQLKDFFAGAATASGAGVSTISSLTNSPVGMKKEWKRFLKDLDTLSRTLEKCEFISEFGDKLPQMTFPIVLIQMGNELAVLINTDEIKQSRDLHDFIGLLRQRLFFE
ncbi:MAG: hypothetical protein WCF90_03675 [Methanomicrobiales archaeon]